MHPAAPFTMRKIEQNSNKCPLEYNNDPKTDGIDMGDGFGCIPPGFLVTYAIAGTLKDDAETYPDPGTFNLVQWLKQKQQSSSSHATYLGFWRWISNVPRKVPLECRGDCIASAGIEQ
mmetsp:Transcript_3746/g.7552  ORF Transcript_3746/g.7552 Transcript_3746/m.7552 type:complete len:118 (+) Transcript_3746:1070-1423(+)